MYIIYQADDINPVIVGFANSEEESDKMVLHLNLTIPNEKFYSEELNNSNYNYLINTSSGMATCVFIKNDSKFLIEGMIPDYPYFDNVDLSHDSLTRISNKEVDLNDYYDGNVIEINEGVILIIVKYSDDISEMKDRAINIYNNYK